MDVTITGDIVGKGLVESNIVINYKISILPSDGTLSSIYTPILMNKRRYVYKRNNDFLQAKLMIYKGKELAYLENVNVEFWLNYTGVWKKYEDYTTNRFGIVHIKYTTNSIPNINCCLGAIRVTIDGSTYNSNLVRFNFTIGEELPSYIIDAGPSGVLDRSTYDIFNGFFRSNVYDRMRG